MVENPTHGRYWTRSPQEDVNAPQVHATRARSHAITASGTRVMEHSPAPSSMQPRSAPVAAPELNPGVDIVKLATILLANRRHILHTVIVGTLLVLPILLLLPSDYTSEARFIPAAPATPGSLGALSGLASSVGLLQGSGGSSDFYADVATSASLLKKVIRDPLVVDSVDGKPVLADYPTAIGLTKDDPLERMDEALAKLQDNMDVTTNHASGIVTIDVTAHSPGLAYQLAEAVLAAINDFNVHSLQTMGRAQREFDERRVALAHDSLAEARGALEAFYQANHDFSSSPSLAMEESVLKQTLQLRQQVYTSAVTDLETARVNEINDTPVLTVVEQPDIPVKASGPHRALLLIGVAMLFAAFAAARALFAEFGRFLREIRPDEFSVLSATYEALSRIARYPILRHKKIVRDQRSMLP